MKKAVRESTDVVLEEMIDELLGISTNVKVDELTGRYPDTILDDPQEIKREVFKEAFEQNDYICFKVIGFIEGRCSTGQTIYAKSDFVKLVVNGKKISLPAVKLQDIIRRNSDEGFVIRESGSEAFYVRVRKQLLLDSAIPV